MSLHKLYWLSNRCVIKIFLKQQTARKVYIRIVVQIFDTSKVDGIRKND